MMVMNPVVKQRVLRSLDLNRPSVEVGNTSWNLIGISKVRWKIEDVIGTDAGI